MCVCACHVCVNVRVCVPRSEHTRVCRMCVFMCVFTVLIQDIHFSPVMHICTRFLPLPLSLSPSLARSLVAPLPFQVCERSEEQSCYQRLDIYRMVCMCTCVSVMLPHAHLDTFATVSGASTRRCNPHTQARVRSASRPATSANPPPRRENPNEGEKVWRKSRVEQESGHFGSVHP